MANKVTGSTDITGALSIASNATKSILVVGVVTGTPSVVTQPNTMFSISGTADTKGRFGDESPMIDIVKVLITNGVGYINGIIAETSVEGSGTIVENYTSALNASMGDKTVKVVLVDTNDEDVITAVNTHLTIAEGEDMFRYSVFAPDSTMSTQTDLITFAGTVDNSRVFIVGPNTSIGGTSVAPECVMAGLASAIMMETNDPALPMNGVRILGIGNVGRAVLESERNALAAGGVTALYSDGSMPTIHRLVTSDTTNDVWKEGTTRFIADHVLETVENTLRANYKRTKNVARIIDAIKTDVKTVLENLDELEIIENFDPSTLTVTRDPADVYGALIDYEFDVVTPLYTITINQHLKL